VSLVLVLVGGVTLFAASKEVREAEAGLKAALRQGNLPAVDAAVATLVGMDSADAAETLTELAEKTPPGADRIYWRLLNGAASMRSAEALGQVAKAITRSRKVGHDLLFAMQNNRSKHVPVSVHQLVLDKGTEEQKLMAADQCGAIDSVEAVDVLIRAYSKYERKGGELATRILGGLQAITGADLGTASNWEKWWETARAEGVKGRSERGEMTGTVVDEMPPTRGEEVGAPKKLTPEQVLVIVADCERDPRACNYDDIGAVLDQMQVAHTVVTKKDFEAGKADLQKALIMLVTCVQINDHCICAACVPGGGPTTNRMTQCTGCDVHDTRNHKFSADAIKRIKAWVEAGGYIFTEDWGLADVLERAWPKKVKTGQMLKQRTVGVTPGRGVSAHPLLRGVFLNPEVARRSQEEEEEGGTVTRNPADGGPADDGIQRFWAIDDDSPYIDIVGTGVTVLLESDDLAQSGGRASRAVGVTFLPTGARSEKQALRGQPEGLQGGRVLHVLSHFGKQQSQRDEFSLQNLMLNFLMEANRRHQQR
ncbi:MAG: hypothetical protein ACYTDX_10845, partial [Planctomycetota bacterium]